MKLGSFLSNNYLWTVVKRSTLVNNVLKRCLCNLASIVLFPAWLLKPRVKSLICAQLKSFKCARAQLKSLKCARARSYLFELEKFRRFPSQCHLGNIKKEKKKYDSTFGTETVYFIGQALKSEYEIIPPRKGKKNMVNHQRLMNLK